MPKQPTIKEVDTEPEVKIDKDEMVVIKIDKDMTDGGIRINGRRYVGTVRVSQALAEDLLRIQDEYWETKKKLLDTSVSVRMKSDFQKEALFLADPKEHGSKKTFTHDYGLLGAREWSLCNKKFQEHLLEQRMMLYGY